MAAVCGMGVWADTIAVQQMGIQYYLPKTEATLYVQYQQESYHPGKYAKWAHKLLGIDEVVMQDTVVYSVNKVMLKTHAVVDPERAYTILPQEGQDIQLLNLSPEGLLQGYNVEVEQAHCRHHCCHRHAGDTTCSHSAAVPSLLESTFKSDSAFAQAKNIAKQIFQIRDNRIFLLSGELENMPSDGIAIQALLQEMDRQEQALTALFTGEVTKTIGWKQIAIDPAMAQDTLLCQIGQDSLQLHIEIEKREPAPVVEEPKKGKSKKAVAPQPSPICYNMPGKAHIQVTQGEEILLNETIQVAQLGISIPLEAELFVGEPVHIRFDVQTGNILSITRGK